MRRHHASHRGPAVAVARSRSITLGRHVSLILALGALVSIARPAGAAPVVVGGGFDYYAAGEQSSTRSALVFGAASLGGFDVLAAGLRFDHDAVGWGSGVMLGGGVPIAPLTQLRLTGTRFIGDGEYRAWRFKTGPKLRLPTGAALGLYYTRDQNDSADPIQGVLAEGEAPIAAAVSARATAGYAASGDSHSLLGSVGAGWSPVRSLLLSAEIGMTQDATIDGRQPVAGSRGGLGSLPIVGGGAPSSSSGGEETRSAITTLIGIRISLP